MEKKLIRDMDRKVLGGVVAGLQRLYAPQVDLMLLRVVAAVLAVCIPPVIVAYAALWIIAPRSDQRQLQPVT
ncbi:PspC domain-containing protein [Deinococcus sp. AJ005]|uniref:PspC domain-containing protein n=1 Tax=Deinococcus sp. AJ005 TaxID=2652443 RepID=UPI00125CAFBC|nr:PspC domain-containing protein [Deinococcus sp. AJ005]QFP78078.1 PspC domain-containing protein [Deinococcus sp. AJ005]